MDTRTIILENALDLAAKTDCGKVFVFLDTSPDLEWFASSHLIGSSKIVLVLPGQLHTEAAEGSLSATARIRSWSGNQSRFSRIKYAFLQAVLDGLIGTDERIVCVLGPSGKSHLDTLTIHDLSLSWSEEFPFDVRPLIDSGFIHTIMAVMDIALDLGALGREGKAVGTIFVIGDSEAVLNHSHQAVFNPFKGYDRAECQITRSEVVESMKELARLDGATIITADGFVEAAGRHLDSGSHGTNTAHGLGARHRAAAGITIATAAVSIVVSESTGKVTIFREGKTIATLEPLISRRVV